ncbi:MAG: hypothetical protein GF346_08795 [Candidatus Eisenbacteria bacterium]|nr:hypothetical protein [Candidatus Latescibacterota bacterium]MBD3302532.1 hypothetical protein [Candidatus Eisenbacteria bacterium]
MEFRVAERPPESESDAEAKAKTPVSVLRQTFADLPSTQGTGRTSVWLPEQVRGDLEAAVGEVDPPPCPVWMVLLSLFVEASRVWQQVDPQRKPR